MAAKVDSKKSAIEKRRTGNNNASSSSNQIFVQDGADTISPAPDVATQTLDIKGSRASDVNNRGWRRIVRNFTPS